MNNSNAQIIQDAINELALVSDHQQDILNRLTQAGASRVLAGQLLAISRNVDTLERVKAELADLLPNFTAAKISDWVP
ncbi:hypothetical protein KBY99_14625 [Cyanobium sp. Maggiore-St4-Cus]|uniref:hypothetical protein n=1 Tax=Cyanobium sp. Maggiore-St4-Cus TaxID=2823717 RepID=UPI0020CF4714|nr:hypothetical protein [Cyanobium sp. Maggiore-St4-Cus]MCP9790197.1 hypothetical protein [Cyanobium sp. Maggiore-St4-Cus]